MPFLLWFILLTGAMVARGETGSSSSGEFPFEYREGLLWVRVRVAECEEPLRFLLDSGAEVSVVSLDTARRLKLALAHPVGVRGVQASLTGYWPQRLSATANGVILPADFLALDLSKFSAACTQSVDGLIGADFFKGRIVQIDFLAQQIRVLDASDSALNTGSSPLEVRRCGLCVMASIDGGKPQRLRLDTGGATALQWVTSRERVERCSSRIAIGLAQLDIPQTQTTVTLGKHTFHAVPTGLHREPIFDGEAGLLGNGILSRFESVTFDSRGGWLTLGRLRGSQ